MPSAHTWARPQVIPARARARKPPRSRRRARRARRRNARAWLPWTPDSSASSRSPRFPASARTCRRASPPATHPPWRTTRPSPRPCGAPPPRDARRRATRPTPRARASLRRRNRIPRAARARRGERGARRLDPRAPPALTRGAVAARGRRELVVRRPVARVSRSAANARRARRRVAATDAAAAAAPGEPNVSRGALVAHGRESRHGVRAPAETQTHARVPRLGGATRGREPPSRRRLGGCARSVHGVRPPRRQPAAAQQLVVEMRGGERQRLGGNHGGAPSRSLLRRSRVPRGQDLGRACRLERALDLALLGGARGGARGGRLTRRRRARAQVVARGGARRRSRLRRRLPGAFFFF